MSRCAGCGYGPFEAGFRFCPWCARPAAPATSLPPPSPEPVDPWTWRERILLITAVGLGIATLLAIAYLVLVVWLGLRPVEVVAWALTGWICLRILAWGFGLPAPSLPIRRTQLDRDGTHDAAISIAAVLGARDAIHRR